MWFSSFRSPLCFFVLPHRASLLYTFRSSACILPRRYCMRNLLPVTVISSFTSSLIYSSSHTHGVLAHCQYSLALVSGAVERVINLFQMACLSDLFLFVAEIWQEARSAPLLSDRYKAYMGGVGGGRVPLRKGRRLQKVSIYPL